MSDYTHKVLPETSGCPKRATVTNQATPYGHDEAMRDLLEIGDGWPEQDRLATYIERLEQDLKYEREVWNHAGTLELAEAERDEWEVVARVLADRCATFEYDDNRETDGYTHTDGSDWLAWAREQVKR